MQLIDKAWTPTGRYLAPRLDQANMPACRKESVSEVSASQSSKGFPILPIHDVRYTILTKEDRVVNCEPHKQWVIGCLVFAVTRPHRTA